jgi:hypothetical protein
MANPSPPVWFDNFVFANATCRCSRRSAREEELYGSYCGDCWDVIKDQRSCITCGAKVEHQRLYVDTVFRRPTCRQHFPARE